MSTRTRFEKEAKGNSEMAYSMLINLLVSNWILIRLALGIPDYCVGKSVIICLK